MAKIFIITGGGYSDYSIFGAFTDRTAADRAAFALHLNVEEYDLDPPSDYPPGKRAYYVMIRSPNHPENRDGRQIVAYSISRPPEVDPGWLTYPCGDRSYEYAEIWAETKEEAIAIAAHRGYRGP